MSQSGPISSNSGGGGGGDVTSVNGTLNQIAVAPTTGNVIVALTSGISLGSFQLIAPPAGGAIFPGQVGIGTSAPNSSAILALQSTTQGFSPPQMNVTQRDAIVTPALGLTIFDLSSAQLEYWNGVSWVSSSFGAVINFSGDTGTPFSTGAVTIHTNNSTLVCGSSVLIDASTPNLTLQVTDSNNNTIIGKGSGVLVNSATTCTALGGLTLTAITDDTDQVALGYSSLKLANDGTGNTAAGVYSLATLTSGGFNTAIGNRAGLNLVTGNFNLLLGYVAGQNYVGAESSNTLIANLGVVGENQVMRIGTTGAGPTQVLSTYIAGITPNTSPSATTGSILYIDQVTEQVTTAQFLDLPTTTDATHGTIQLNGSVVQHFYTPQFPGFSGTNIFIGRESGNFTMTGIGGPTGNIGIGDGTLSSIDTASGNGYICIGANSGNLINSGGGNSILIGLDAGKLGLGFSNCLLLGQGVAGNVITTLANCLIFNSDGIGGNYTGGESNNILLQNSGVLGEVHAMRLGTTGVGSFQVSSTYIAGVVGAVQPVSGNLVATWNSSTEQVTLVPDGSAGFVLSTNGLGSLSWESLSGVSVTSVTGTTNQIVASPSTGAVSLSFANGLSVGSYQAVSPPAGGLILPNTMGLGTSSPDAGSMLTITPKSSVFYGIEFAGSLAALDGLPGQFAILDGMLYHPTAPAQICASFSSFAEFIIPTTLTNAVSFYANSSARGGGGTITNMIGFYYGGGLGSSGVTITNAYGANFKTPITGNNRIALYSDNVAIGTLGTAPPTNGLLVLGNIQNTALTALQVVATDGSKNLVSIASSTAGFVLTSNGASAPTFQAPSSGGITWSSISADQALTVNSGFFCVSPGGALQLSLPATSAQGDQITLALDGATSFEIIQGAGQSILYGNQNTSAGVTGSLASTQQGDTVTLVCRVANLRWVAINTIGNLTVV